MSPTIAMLDLLLFEVGILLNSAYLEKCVRNTL